MRSGSATRLRGLITSLGQQLTKPLTIVGSELFLVLQIGRPKEVELQRILVRQLSELCPRSRRRVRICRAPCAPRWAVAAQRNRTIDRFHTDEAVVVSLDATQMATSDSTVTSVWYSHGSRCGAHARRSCQARYVAARTAAPRSCAPPSCQVPGSRRPPRVGGGWEHQQDQREEGAARGQGDGGEDSRTVPVGIAFLPPCHDPGP